MNIKLTKLIKEWTSFNVNVFNAKNKHFINDKSRINIFDCTINDQP